MVAKILLKVSLIAFMAFGLITYVNYLMTGQVPAIFRQTPHLSDFKSHGVKESLSDKATQFKETINEKLDAIPSITGNSKSTLYKWRDEKGQLNYTNDPPPKGIKFEKIILDSRTNVIPSIKSSKNTEVETSKPSPTMQTERTHSFNKPSDLYSPEGIEQLINQAKDVQNLVDERYKNQQKMIEKN